MAHFFIEGRGTTAANFVNVNIGQTAMVGCWGASVNGTSLTVSCNDPSVATVVSAGTKSGDGTIHNIGLKGLRAGSVMLEARLGASGPVWAFTQLVVAAAGAGAAPAASGTASAALDLSFANAVLTRQIVFNNAADLRLVNDITAGKVTNVQIGPELQRLLSTLAGSGKVGVMSLYRRGQGPHGMIQPDGTVICRGVDITSYAGVPVSLRTPSVAIDVVTNLISHFPAARFDLGFPRPIGGKWRNQLRPQARRILSRPRQGGGHFVLAGKGRASHECHARTGAGAGTASHDDQRGEVSCSLRRRPRSPARESLLGGDAPKAAMGEGRGDAGTTRSALDVPLAVSDGELVPRLGVQPSFVDHGRRVAHGSSSRTSAFAIGCPGIGDRASFFRA